MASKNQPIPLADKHSGMRVDYSGMLSNARRCMAAHETGSDDVSDLAGSSIFMLEELEKHLEMLAKEYYSGNIAIVDKFLQLYCLDDDRPGRKGTQ